MTTIVYIWLFTVEQNIIQTCFCIIIYVS